MTVSPRLWFSTFVALIFVIGVSAGVFVDRTWLTERRGDFRPGPDGRGRGAPPPQLVGPPPDRLIQEFDNELHLSSDQRDRILAILEAHRPQVRALQEDARKKFTDEQQKLQDEIAGVLTADQATKFRDMMARRPPEGPPGRLGPPGRGRREGPGRE